ncbi:hypothetical protein [Pseudodesulfovibrio senegalensis]|uniref:Uncharacterized protein n=1 Tax=Pseudodesulfovibrio senegalensis TaxID=1721087 RepID=A0A6N6N1I5_9BACT|nr:hypothetical protein [Pseudodesulfovibrio senegalensis]KAB1441610.1 hypothetical protein F8A88_08385 [Pseudodesulfovibrio senegalensis]
MTQYDQRAWIRYEDGSYEPVRMNGDIRRKKRGPGIPLWWIMNMPRNWMPQAHGHAYTSNHPSGALSRRFGKTETAAFIHAARQPAP